MRELLQKLKEDNELSKEDKIELLNSWIERFEYMMATTIQDSKMFKINTDNMNNLKNTLEELQDENSN